MSVGAAYFGNRVPRHVAADMQALAERGFTGVLHTFSENDLAFYRETMGRLVAVSHDAGLEVQIGPWGVCQMFGGEAESRLTAAHPEVCQVLDTGHVTPAGCPNNPRVRAFCREWADAAIDTGADRIFWDEPHWVHPEHFGLPATSWGCRCEHCCERFGSELPRELDEKVLAFREASMVDFLGDLVGHVARQGGRSVVCVMPITGGVHGISDWSKLAALPGLDTLSTDPYWRAFGEPVEPFVREYSRHVARLGAEHGVRPQIWIQGFRMEPEEAANIATAVAIAREEGVEDLWVWGWEACAHMSALAGSDPAAVWEALCDALVGR